MTTYTHDAPLNVPLYPRHRDTAFTARGPSARRAAVGRLDRLSGNVTRRCDNPDCSDAGQLRLTRYGGFYCDEHAKRNSDADALRVAVQVAAIAVARLRTETAVRL